MTHRLGVVIVTYNASDVICDCLHTLIAAGQTDDIVLVDNASTDDTLAVVSTWIGEPQSHTLPDRLPFEISPVQHVENAISVIANSANDGFAAGVNIGLRYLLDRPHIDRVWILNPDTLIPPGTPQAFATAPEGFSLMGGRVLYADPPYLVQTDAGTVNRWTGVTSNLNLGAGPDAPLANGAQADFISGASMVASRAFIEASGPMPEEYFLYYEEVDWAQRRGPLPLVILPGAQVYHRAGTAIGSPTLTQVASEFSTYYKFRARMMYLRQHHPVSLPIGYLYACAKALQFIKNGHRAQAMAVLKAINGVSLSPDEAPQSGDQTIQRRA
ncbi:MAG: glycosyltransferase family 2 protein [Pseudomonadota bacterium]